MKTPLTFLLVLSVATLIAASGPLAAQDAPKPHVPLQKTIGKVTPTGPVPSLFVLNSEGATLADGKLTMTGVSPNSIVFADRPIRSAGHVMTAQFIQQWDEDKGNFLVEPPNATISVLGGVGSDVSDAVVTLMKPVLDGSTLTFEVKVLEGALAGSGPAALFIDRGGFGGGGRGDFRGGGDTFNDVHVNDDRAGTYWHAPDYHGAWYGAGDVAAGAAVGAAVGVTAADRAYNDGLYPNYGYPPYCGYAPYPPCN